MFSGTCAYSSAVAEPGAGCSCLPPRGDAEVVSSPHIHGATSRPRCMQEADHSHWCHLPAAGEATETPACDRSHTAQHLNQALAFLTPWGWERSPTATRPLRGCELEQDCRWHRGDRRQNRHLLAAGVPVPLENHEAHGSGLSPVQPLSDRQRASDALCQLPWGPGNHGLQPSSY